MQALEIQARKLEHTVESINYSNNELCLKSIAFFNSLINTTYYNSVTTLRLSNLKISESGIMQMLEPISRNTTLTKLRLSNINLGTKRKSDYLIKFLFDNNTIMELDLSWTCLNLGQ